MRTPPAPVLAAIGAVVRTVSLTACGGLTGVVGACPNYSNISFTYLPRARWTWGPIDRGRRLQVTVPKLIAGIPDSPPLSCGRSGATCPVNRRRP